MSFHMSIPNAAYIVFSSVKTNPIWCFVGVCPFDQLVMAILNIGLLSYAQFNVIPFVAPYIKDGIALKKKVLTFNSL